MSEALRVNKGETVLVAGSGGVTGGLLVQMANVRGARVIATAGPSSPSWVRALAASEVVDYNDPGWPEQDRRLGVAAASMPPRRWRDDNPSRWRGREARDNNVRSSSR